VSARPSATAGERELRFAAADRLLMLAPHPDDEALAAGGLLQSAIGAGAEVRVLYVTSGENNPWAQRAIEWKWRLGEEDRSRWGARRWEEALGALARLGVPAPCAKQLGFPDQGLTDLLLRGGADLIEVLAEEISSWRPTVLLVPAPWDVHPDHSALALLAHLASARVPGLADRAPALRYVVHGRAGPRPGGGVWIHLSEEMRARKREAILCHRTQLPLRRGYLLRFADATERFGLADAEPDHGGQHPIADLAVEDGSLRVEIHRRIPGGLGNARLLVALERCGGAASVLEAELESRSRRARVLAEAAWRRGLDLSIRAERDLLRLSIPLPEAWEAREGSVFAKLERTAMRRLGFFDAFGWSQAWPPSPNRARADGPGRRDSEAESEAVALASAATDPAPDRR
jgi:LmbE family N-acetylglucosaminyl deacetylase